MGVDVNLYVEGDLPAEGLADAEALLHRSGIAWRDKDDARPVLRVPEYLPPRVELHTDSRYYGPGYERGDWPAIYGAIRLMQAAFPGRPVHYGGDTSDYAPP